jgi:hypothetical protein
MQDLSKIPGRNSRVSSSHQNEVKSSLKHTVFPEVSDASVSLKVSLKDDIEKLIYVCIILLSTDKVRRLYTTRSKVRRLYTTRSKVRRLYTTRSKFTNCLVLTVYQATLQNRCSKYPPFESMHSSTRLIMDCHTLSKVPGRLRLV